MKLFKLLVKVLKILAITYLLIVLTFISYNLVLQNKSSNEYNELLSKNVSTTSATPSPKGLFEVPFHFDYLDIPHTYSREKPMQVGHMVGKGTIQSIAFHSGYYGIAVGYSVDGSDVIWINNGHCLKEWKADSTNARDLPVRLLTYVSDYDLAMAVNTPISFKKDFKLYFYNSSPDTTYAIRSLHLYGYFEDVEFGEGNMLKF